MKDLVRVSLRQHPKSALLCAAATLLVGVLVQQSVPRRWTALAEVYVHEPVATHRIANPFAPAPRPGEGLAEVGEQLTSRAALVAMVKRTGLVDQWASSRPWALRQKDRLLQRLRGPVSEADRLDALVALLEKQLAVTVEGQKVQVVVQWPSRDAAYWLVRAALANLTRQRETGEVAAFDKAAGALGEQLAGLQADMDLRVQRMEATRAAAQAEGRRAVLEADREQLRRDQGRSAELLMRQEEKLLTAQVLRRTNAHRFVVLRPPELPRRPEGPGPLGWALLLVAAAAVSGLAGPLVLSLASGLSLSGPQVSRAVGLPVLARLLVRATHRPPPPARWAVVGAAALAVGLGVSAGASKGQPMAALLPALGLGGAYLVWTKPLRWPLLLLMLAAVTVDDPTDRPYVGLWQSPLWTPGRLLYTNVAWFTGFELCLLALFGVMLLRRVVEGGAKAQALDPVAFQAPRVLRGALALSFVTVAALVVMGLARGGVLREALWQFRALLMMPVVCTLVAYAFDFPRDLKPLAWVLTAGVVVKAALGTWFIYRVAVPMGEYPPHTTGHNDTMVFVTATVLGCALVWEKATFRSLAKAAVLLGFAAMAMRLNDRRIAYVDIALVAGFVFLVSPLHRMKRFATRALVASLPLLLVFTVAGWNSRGGGVFKPVQKVRSIVAPAEDSEEESSNVERDIENFNLMKSWEGNMVLGQGFGHAFHEFIPSNDFSQSRFGHIGHNSILWLLWIGGVVGFTLALLYLAVGAYLLGRTLKVATATPERVGLLVALGVLLTYLLQAFGDMGLLSIQFDFFVAAALAIAGRLAARHRVLEAPPEPVELPAASLALG